MKAVEGQRSLKKPIWSLIILNLLDGVLTYLGLSLGVITEQNPLLATLTPLAILTTKAALSLCLFSFLFTSFVRVESRFWQWSLLFANGLYAYVLLLHSYWLVVFLT